MISFSSFSQMVVDTVPSTRVVGTVLVDSAVVVSDSVRLMDDVNVYGDLNLRSGTLNLGPDLSLRTSISGGAPVLSFGRQVDPFPLPLNPCTNPSADPWFMFPKRIQIFDNTSNVALTMGSDGVGSSIDASGNGGLLVNYYCGKNILLGTGSGPGGTGAGKAGSIVYVGDELHTRKNVQIGNDGQAIDPNVSLNVFPAPGMDGIKLTSFVATDKLINSSSGKFVVYADGNTQLGQAIQVGYSNSSIQNINTSINIDAQNRDGIHISNTANATRMFWVDNVLNSSVSYAIYGDGNVHMGKYNQIGFSNSAIQNGNVALNINNGNYDGILFNTFNNAAKMISVNNYANLSAKPAFLVTGEGRTEINTFDVAAALTIRGLSGGIYKPALLVNGNGQTCIGCDNPGTFMLAVEGKMGAREIKVTKVTPWPDYVFQTTYELQSLEQVESYVKANKHLPGIPAASEIENENYGLNVGEMQGLQMQKIEDIYLYLIEMKKEIEALKNENSELKKLIK